MKKALLILGFLIFGITGLSSAQDITGKWLWADTKTENGKTSTSYSVVEFKGDGVFEVMGMKWAKWKFDAANQKLQLEGRLWVGPTEVILLNDSNFQFNTVALQFDGVTKDKMTFDLVRLDTNIIQQDNNASGLAGTWTIKDNESTFTFTFSIPDTYTAQSVKSTGGVTETSNHWGYWYYNPMEKSIRLVGTSEMLDGKSTFRKLTSAEFQVENDGKLISAHKTGDE